MFDDLLEANRMFVRDFTAPTSPSPAKHVAVVTCMDHRLDPAAMLGLVEGDGVVIRNAGARITDAELSALVVARHLLGVERVMVIAHTGCRMNVADETEIHEAIAGVGGPDTRARQFVVTPDQRSQLHADVDRIVNDPLLRGLAVGGFLYDVQTGVVEPIR